MSTDSTVRTDIAPAPLRFSRLGVYAASVAAINAAVFGIGAAAGATMSIDPPIDQEVMAIPVIAASLVPFLIAGVVTMLVARRRHEFRRVARWAGLAFGLVSIAAPLMLAADAATAATLAPMHLIATAAWVIYLRPGVGDRARM